MELDGVTIFPGELVLSGSVHPFHVFLEVYETREEAFDVRAQVSAPSLLAYKEDDVDSSALSFSSASLCLVGERHGLIAQLGSRFLWTKFGMYARFAGLIHSPR